MSIQIGKHIAHTLLTTPKVKAMVGNRVFPVIYPVEKGAPVYPYIVYANNGISDTDSKMCDTFQDEGTAEIIVCAKTYPELIDVANSVRIALDGALDLDYDTFSLDGWDVSTGNDDYDLQAGCFFLPIFFDYVTTIK